MKNYIFWDGRGSKLCVTCFTFIALACIVPFIFLIISW